MTNDLTMTLEQSYAVLVSIGVGSMLVPIVMVLTRIANARMKR